MEPSIRIIEDRLDQEKTAPQSTGSSPMITIRNKRTGETKQVPATQAQDFGLDPEEAFRRVVAQQKLTNLEQGLPAEDKSEGTSEQIFKKKQAANAINELERLFGRGDSANVGGDKDLSQASGGSFFDRTGAKIRGLTLGAPVVGDPRLKEDLNIYKSQIDLAKGVLTQALGSGTPQAAEAIALLESAPNLNSTDREAKQWFESVRKIAGIETNDTSKKKDELSLDLTDNSSESDIGFKNVEPGAEIGTVLPDTPPDLERSGLKDIAGKVADLAPVVFGTAGGIGGGLLGGTAGSIVPGAGTAAGGIVGSAAGTAIGTGAGVAVQNMIEDLAGIQDESANEQIASSIKQAGVAGVTDLVLGGALHAVASGAGLVLKSGSKIIDDIPLKSIRVNPSQLTKFASKNGEDMAEFMVKNNILGENAYEIAAGKAGELQNAFDGLALNEGISIPANDVKDRFVKEIKNLAGVTDEGVKTKITPSFNKGIAKNILDEWNNIATQLDQMGTQQLNAKQITEFRRAIDDVIPESQWVNPSIKNTALRLRGIMNELVQNAVDKTMLAPEAGGAIGEAGLKDLGKQLSKYYDFLTIAEKQSNLGRGNLAANLPRLLSSGFGGVAGTMAGGPVGGAVGIAGGLTLEALLRDPKVLSGIFRGGQVAKNVVPKIGNVVKAVGKSASPLVGAGLGSSI